MISEVMEWTRIVDFNTFDLCDLDLEGIDLVVALCTSSYNGNHMCQSYFKNLWQYKSYGANTKMSWTDRQMYKQTGLGINKIHYARAFKQ